MKLAVIFNGQGAHFEGMGLDFVSQYPESRELMEEAEAVTGFPLRTWIESEEDRFKQTRYAQPAIASVSLAIYAAIKDRLPDVSVMAGLSLGEYSALMASGMMDVAAGLDLLKTRGDLMSAWCEQLKSEKKVAELAVVGVPMDQVEDLVLQARASMGPLDELYITNDNAPTQQVIAGTKDGIKTFRKQAKAEGYRDLIPLRIEGPFHSPMMAPMADDFYEVVQQVDFRPSPIPVISNVTVAPHQVDQMADTLTRHLTSRVRWTETIEAFQAAGISHVLQIGPGDTLDKQLARYEDGPKHQVIDRVEDVAKLDAFLTE